MPDWIHPETGTGEVFFMNMTAEHFAAFPCRSKRKGAVACDGEGNRLEFSDWFPVFIVESDLPPSGHDLLTIRRAWRVIMTLMRTAP